MEANCRIADPALATEGFSYRLRSINRMAMNAAIPTKIKARLCTSGRSL